MNQADWEAHFRSLAGRQLADPDPRVTELVKLHTSAASAISALDLACGAGANALWLAEQGWDVTAVDRSPAAIDLLDSEAARRGLKINTKTADLEAHDFVIERGAWDLILMCRYLRVDLFEPARLGLAPGGLLIVIALLADPAIATDQRFRVRAGELASHFRGEPGFTIVHEKETVTSSDDFSERRAVAEIAVLKR